MEVTKEDWLELKSSRAMNRLTALVRAKIDAHVEAVIGTETTTGDDALSVLCRLQGMVEGAMLFDQIIEQYCEEEAAEESESNAENE